MEFKTLWKHEILILWNKSFPGDYKFYVVIFVDVLPLAIRKLPAITFTINAP